MGVNSIGGGSANLLTRRFADDDDDGPPPPPPPAPSARAARPAIQDGFEYNARSNQLTGWTPKPPAAPSQAQLEQRLPQLRAFKDGFEPNVRSAAKLLGVDGSDRGIPEALKEAG